MSFGSSDDYHNLRYILIFGQWYAVMDYQRNFDLKLNEVEYIFGLYILLKTLAWLLQVQVRIEQI